MKIKISNRSTYGELDGRKIYIDKCPSCGNDNITLNLAEGYSTCECNKCGLIYDKPIGFGDNKGTSLSLEGINHAI